MKWQKQRAAELHINKRKEWAIKKHMKNIDLIP